MFYYVNIDILCPLGSISRYLPIPQVIPQVSYLTVAKFVSKVKCEIYENCVSSVLVRLMDSSDTMESKVGPALALIFLMYIRIDGTN